MPSSNKPTPDQVARALAAIPRREQAVYFFSKLENPEWLQPLEKSGIFKSPPVIQRDEEAGTINFPIWPQGRYLVKVAPRNPEAVASVIERIPDTNNFRVHQDYLEAARMMPPDIAVRLVKSAVKWWKASHGRHLADDLERFLLHLARGGYLADAFRLTKALLTVKPDPDSNRKWRDREKSSLGPESLKPALQTEWFRLRHLLREGFPELGRLDPLESIKVLASTLNRLVTYSVWEPEKRRPIDLSGIWRPTIEKDARNWEQDVRNEIVVTLRKTCEFTLRENLLSFEQIEEILLSQRWDIFERLLLHLCREFSSLAGSRIDTALTNRGLFERPDLTHEYTLLLQAHFSKLDPLKQETILGWIAEGPPHPETSSADELLSDEEQKWQRYAKQWTLRHLRPIAGVLPENWADRYRALVAEYGEPVVHDTVVWSEGWKIGRDSPKSLDELREMEIPEIVEFLRTWQPVKGSMDMSAASLGSRIQQLAAEKSELLSANAELFRNVEPTYVRALMAGLTSAVEKGQSIVWGSLLSLCDWATTQSIKFDPERNSGIHEDEDQDTNWCPTRREVARLIHEGIKSKESSIPFVHRPTVWDILNTLCEDSEPSVEEEAASSHDPMTLALNTTRGIALGTLADYGLWIRRNHANAQLGSTPINFAAMPELRDKLEAHLDPTREATLTAHTAYGRDLPWLHLLDPEWTHAHLPEIFPREEKAESFRRVAWFSYVCLNRDYDELLPLLEQEYRWAVDELAEELPETIVGFCKPEEALADHLLSFYWRGSVDFKDGGSLLAGFYARASDSVCARVMWAVGRALEESKTTPALELLSRWQRFWEWRLEVIKQEQQATSHQQELNGFVWWLVSDRFDDTWALTQMTDVLHLVEIVEHETLTSEHLAKISIHKPLESLELFDLLLKKVGLSNTWFVSPEETRTILRNAYQSKQPFATAKADQVRDLLLSLGHLNFRDIAQESDVDTDSAASVQRQSV